MRLIVYSQTTNWSAVARSWRNRRSRNLRRAKRASTALLLGFRLSSLPEEEEEEVGSEMYELLGDIDEERDGKRSSAWLD